MISIIWHSGKSKTMEAIKRSVVAKDWWVGERMNRQNTENFLGNENTLYDNIMMDTYYYPFVQIHKIYNTKNEL